MRANFVMPQVDSTDSDKKVASTLQELALWLAVVACAIATVLAAQLPL